MAGEQPLTQEQKQEILARVHGMGRFPAEYAIYEVKGGKVDKEAVAANFRDTGLSEWAIRTLPKYMETTRNRDIVELPERSFGTLEGKLRGDPLYVDVDLLECLHGENIPIQIETGYGIAELVRTARTEGFLDASGINFVTRHVQAGPQDQEYFESRGFSFVVAGEDYYHKTSPSPAPEATANS